MPERTILAMVPSTAESEKGFFSSLLSLVTGTILLERFPIEEKAKVLFLYGENTRNGLQAIQRKQVNAAKEEGWQFIQEDLDNLILQEARGLMVENVSKMVTKKNQNHYICLEMRIAYFIRLSAGKKLLQAGLRLMMW